MRKRFTQVLIFLFLFNMLLPGAAYAANNRRDVLQRGPEELMKGGFFDTGKLGTVKRPEDAVNLIINRQKALNSTTATGLGFKVNKTKTDNTKKTHIRLQQLYQGVPVYGQQVIVHTDNSGQVYAVNGSEIEKIDVDTNTKVTQKQALEIAKEAINPLFSKDDTSTLSAKIADSAKKISNSKKQDSTVTSSNVPSEDAQLTQFAKRIPKLTPKEMIQLNIYSYNGKDYLAYVVDISSSIPKPVAWRIFVDAATGAVINKYDKLADFTRTTAYGYGIFGDRKNLKVIKTNGIYNLIEKTDSTSVFDEYYSNSIFTWDYDILVNYPEYDPLYADSNGVYDQDFQAIGVDAHYYTDVVYNFYKTKFNRNSWDGNGATIDILTYVPVDNAFWSPENKAFFFGLGNSETAPYSSGLDVVAHEFTHAVTDSEVGFIYEGQSGALSESYSDVFACLVDPDWQLGEDIVTPGVPGDATRDMANPEIYGQPSRMEDYVDTLEDNGGVHTNSGIPNKVFYNIASTIGRDDTGKIYYDSLNYLTSSATFIDAKNALLYAAEARFGRNSAQFRAVANGWNAVGINYAPYGLNMTTSNLNNLSEDSAPFQISPALEWDNGDKESVEASEVNWNTSNASVATVSQGMVTITGRGTATITGSLTTSEGETYSGSISFNVKPAISRLQVDKPVLNFTAGSSAASVKATAVFSDGAILDITKLATWNTSNPSSVIVVSPGVIKGTARGEATVTVSYGGKNLGIPVKVVTPLRSVTLDQTQSDLIIGEELQLTPTANYTDGYQEDVSGFTTWTSSNTKIATVAADGTITAVAKGKCTITGKFNNKTARASIQVTYPVASIAVSKPSASLVINGSKVSLKVTAFYTDSTKADVTKTATWEIAEEGSSIATVKQGVLVGIGRGDTVLTVRYKDKAVDVPVIVTPRLKALTSTATALDLVAGSDSVDTSLTASYIDGSPQEDVTSKAVWKSSKTTVATVDQGVITPLAKGTATINGEFNGKRVSIKVTVTNEVSRIVLDKSVVNLASGRTGKLALKAFYVDNTSATTTTSPAAVWTSSDTKVATVKAGTITAVGPGEATITVQYKGQTAEAVIRVDQLL